LICKKRFKRKVSLDQHKNVHIQKTQYKCEYCDKVYYMLDSYKQHLKRVHTKRKVFECNVCHKKISNKGYVEVHKNLHTADKQYKCQFCDKVYFLKHSYRRHLLVQHHRDTKVEDLSSTIDIQQ